MKRFYVCLSPEELEELKAKSVLTIKILEQIVLKLTEIDEKLDELLEKEVEEL